MSNSPLPPYYMYRFMEPLVFGDYPFIMKALIRDGLPEFTEAEKNLVKGSFDFIGVNYYTSRYALSQQFDKNDNYSTFSQYQYAELKGKLCDFLCKTS